MRTMVVLLALAVALPCAAAMSQQQTVADGVYTSVQAARGKREYAVFCESCHADDLSGTNSGDSGAPPLRRDGFMDGSNVNALFTKISQTMPFEAPGSLTPQEYIDIVAFIFQENGFPPGDEALGVDPAVLRNIRIVRKSD